MRQYSIRNHGNICALNANPIHGLVFGREIRRQLMLVDAAFLRLNILEKHRNAQNVILAASQFIGLQSLVLQL
jgi:hypothetical protein